MAGMPLALGLGLGCAMTAEARDVEVGVMMVGGAVLLGGAFAMVGSVQPDFRFG